MPPEPSPRRPDPTEPYPACVPVLTDGVVTLRAHDVADASRIIEQCRSPEMMRWVPVPRPYGEAEAAEFLAKVADGWADPAGRREWAISDRDGRFLGGLGLFERSAGRCEVGFSLHLDARGQGVMARAVRLAAAWAFEEGVEVIQWRAEVGNWASRRVAWACGFDDPVIVRGNGIDHEGRPRDMWHATLQVDEPMSPRHPWLVAPAVEGARVRLREFHDDDDRWLPQTLDDRAARFLTGRINAPQGYAAWVAEHRAQAALGDTVQWAVTGRHTDEVLGAIVLTQLGHPRTHGTARLGGWLLQKWRGQGLMTEAVELAVATAFAERPSGLGVRALGAVADADNVEWARVLRAAGFTQCGRERAAYSHNGGEPRDAVEFDLLATDDRDARRVRPLGAPVIETARLRLRPWRADDRPHPADDPDVAALRFMPAGAQASHEGFEAWLAGKRWHADEGSAVNWCIADRASDRALGAIGLFTRGDGPIDFDAEIGYWVFPSARGRKIVGEALPQVIDHAFRQRADGGLGVSRVHAGTDDDNHASQALLRAAGLREWGRDRQAWRRVDGSLSDGVYFELLASDPR